MTSDGLKLLKHKRSALGWSVSLIHTKGKEVKWAFVLHHCDSEAFQAHYCRTLGKFLEIETLQEV